ncbi:MAG: MvaI/BcnI restriction endonuclease family protein [Bacilli bacterium]|nr:MvaI/BcnI restriction endonuclease family protein [Bacilli bacterium]
MITLKKIARKGYVKSSANGLGAIGLTFEHLLGKENDSMYFPDYYGIEIKCSSRFSRYPISLFSCAFDGPTFPEINRLIEKYGYFDKDFKDKKALQEILSCKNQKKVNNYIFKFDIDEKEEKLFLCIYNLNGELIERKSFVYLDTIYNHLKLKLSSMALVYASTKKCSAEDQFRYYKITIYELIGFHKFIELLKNGTINISLSCRIGKSGKYAGKYKNKNLVFELQKKDINKLFKEIYTYNHDIQNTSNFQIINL